MRSIRSVYLPPLIPLYIGVMLVISPYVLRLDFAPRDLMVNVGMLLCFASVAWMLSRRIEQRLEDTTRTRRQNAELAITELGISARGEFADLLQSLQPREIRLVANRDDARLLLEAVRDVFELRAIRVEALICDWGAPADDYVRRHELSLVMWLRDVAPHTNIRVSKRRTQVAALITSRHAIAIFPFARQTKVFAYAVMARWGGLGSELERELEFIWSEAQPYEDPS